MRCNNTRVLSVFFTALIAMLIQTNISFLVIGRMAHLQTLKSVYQVVEPSESVPRSFRRMLLSSMDLISV